MISVKICKRCSEEKPTSEFPKDSKKQNGLSLRCKCCRNLMNKIWRDSNTDTFKAMRAKYYRNHASKLLAQKRTYHVANTHKKAAYDVAYRDRNRRKIADYKANWDKADRAKAESRLKRNLRRRIVHALRDRVKSDSTMGLVGCTIDVLKEHIERQFCNGMKWENYGQWHVDHIKPCYSFDLSIDGQQRECFHYLNLRPLWAVDNLTRPRPGFNRRSTAKFSIPPSPRQDTPQQQ